MSSWWTVAREKCSLFPRMLMSLYSCSISSVGKETWITSPPRKKGDTFCRSGDIISMRQISSASGGTVTRSRSVTKASASSASSRIICGWSPGSRCSIFTYSSAARQSSP